MTSGGHLVKIKPAGHGWSGAFPDPYPSPGCTAPTDHPGCTTHGTFLLRVKGKVKGGTERGQDSFTVSQLSLYKDTRILNKLIAMKMNILTFKWLRNVGIKREHLPYYKGRLGALLFCSTRSYNAVYKRHSPHPAYHSPSEIWAAFK